MPPGRFRTDLEGFRGIAIVLVVLFHAGVAAFAGGFIGVDLFFVLSGFFITGGLARELESGGGIDLNEFWGRRMLRLSPPLLLVIVATLAVVMTLYAPIDRPAITGFSRYVAMYAGNIELASRARDYFSSGDNPLLHSWSLGVEEQFYLLWPLLLLIPGHFIARIEDETRSTKPLAIIMVVVGVASFIASMIVTQQAQTWAFYMAPTRVWEFALGGLAALWTRQLGARDDKNRSLGALGTTAGVVMIAIALVVFDEGTPYPGYAAALPALGALALIVGGSLAPDSFISGILGASPLRWLGRVSYAWYLWHWPLVGLGGALDPRIGVVGKLAWSAVALGLAWLTYRFVEGSARDGRLSRIPVDRLALYGVAASVAVAGVGHISLKIAERQTSTATQERFARAREDRFEKNCWATTTESWKPCFAGDTSSPVTVALLGDSHAEHWLGALDRAGRERRWKIDAMVKGGCPVSDAPEMTHPRRIRHYRECAQFREAMIQRIVRIRPAAVVLSSWDHYIAMDGSSSSWQVTPEQWEAGLRRTYTRLTAAGIRTIVMRDVPRTHFDVPQCLSRRAAGLPFSSPCEYSRSGSLSPLGTRAQDRAARGLPLRFVDMNDLICPTGTCAPVVNGEVVFTDDNHLTAAFSRSLGSALGERIGNGR